MTHMGTRTVVCSGKDCPICAKKKTARPERTQGIGSGYVRGQFIPNHSGGDFYDKGFWTHVTHGREVR